MWLQGHAFYTIYLAWISINYHGFLWRSHSGRDWLGLLIINLDFGWVEFLAIFSTFLEFRMLLLMITLALFWFSLVLTWIVTRLHFFFLFFFWWEDLHLYCFSLVRRGSGTKFKHISNVSKKKKILMLEPQETKLHC